MAETNSFLKGKRILAVDDEADILETIEDLLDDVHLDTCRDYQKYFPVVLHFKSIAKLAVNTCIRTYFWWNVIYS